MNSIAQRGGDSAQWIGANLTHPQVYYDLKGRPDAFGFTINNNGVVGHIIVGSAAYGFPIFEAGEAAPSSIPDVSEAQSTIKSDLGADANNIGKPTRLLYLGFDHLYATYEVDHQQIAVNMKLKYAKLVKKLEQHMPSPETYKSNKKATSDSKSPSILLVTGASLNMSYYNNGGWCGPCSGVSIGKYYRDVLGYSNLPSNNDMYDYLYYVMYTGANHGATLPQNYGPGFDTMAEEEGGYYSNFTYANDWVWHADDYWSRVSDIDNGHPIAVLSSQFAEPWSDPSGDFPPDGWHWVSMRGYDYAVDHLIQVTDSFTSQSNLWLDWDNLGTMIFSTTIID